MGKPDAPEAPTPADLEPIIRLQAEVNRTNQRNPYGQQRWRRDANGGWTNETSFNPATQALFERQMMMAAQQPRQIDHSQGNPLANALLKGIADSQYGDPAMKDSLKGMMANQGGKPGQSGRERLPDIDMQSLLAQQDDDDADNAGRRNAVPGAYDQGTGRGGNPQPGNGIGQPRGSGQPGPAGGGVGAFIGGLGPGVGMDGAYGGAGGVTDRYTQMMGMHGNRDFTRFQRGFNNGR